MNQPPAGWYPNPDSGGGLRYWNGRQWTEFTHGPPPGVEPTVAAASPQPATETIEAPEPPRGVGIAILGFALGAGGGIGAIAALDAAGNPGGDVVELIVSLAVLWAGLLGAVFYVSRRRGTGSLRRDFGWGFRGQDVGIGALGAIIGRSTTVVVAIPLYAAFHDLLRNPSVGLPVDKLTGGLFATYAVTACIGAPIVEELYFRGLIQSRLVWRFGTTRGIGVTSAMFGSAHLIGWQGPASLLAATAIGAGGVVLGYLRNRTGRLGTSQVAHALFNAFAVLLIGIGVGR
jgi:hypothetical protein